MEASFDFARGGVQTGEGRKEKSKLSGTVIDGDATRLPSVTVNIASEDTGLSVRKTITDENGKWSVEVEEGDYTVTANLADEEAIGSITHEGNETVVPPLQVDISLCDGNELFVLPQEPVTHQTVRTGVCGGDAADWEIEGPIGDSPTSKSIGTGFEARHAFNSPGEYEITANTEGKQHTKTVEVDEAEFAIKRVENVEHRGIGVANTPMQLRYDVHLKRSEFLESVEVNAEFTGPADAVSVEKKSADKWRVKIDSGNTDPGTYDMKITAQAEDDIRATYGWSMVEIVDTPRSITWLGNTFSDGLNRAEVGDEVLPSDSLAFEPWNVVLIDQEKGWDPFDVAGGDDYTLGAGARAELFSGITIPETNLIYGGEGSGEFSYIKGGVDGKITVEGESRIGGGPDRDWDFQFLRFDATISTDWTPISKELLVGGDSVGGKLDLVVSPSVGLTGKFEDEVSFSEFSGGIDPAAEVTGEVTVTAPGAEVGGNAGGRTTGEIRFNVDSPFFRGVRVGSEAWVEAYMEALFYSGETRVTLVDFGPECISLCPKGKESTLTLNEMDASTDEKIDFSSNDLTVASKGGEQPPEVDLGAGGNPHDRLSDRPYEDSQPSVAIVGDRQVVVWSSQDEEKEVVEGRDIVYRTRDGSSGGWSDTDVVTDDTLHDQNPDIETGKSDTALVAWTRVTKDARKKVPSFSEAASSTEVAFSVYDSNTDTWTGVETIGNDDNVVSNVVVEGYGNGWIVAWEENKEGLFADESKTVELGFVNGDGDLVATGETGSKPTSMPDLGVSEEGTPQLAHYEKEGDNKGEIVMSELSISDSVSINETERYETQSVSSLSLSGGRLVWSESRNATEQLIYHVDTGGENDPDGVEPNANISRIDDIVFEYNVEDDRGVLVYRGRNGIKQEKRDVAYRLLDDGDWVRDRRVAEGEKTNLTLFYLDVESGDDGFVLGYSAKKFGLEPVGDIFVAEHEYLPEFTIEADASESGAELGDTVTVDYTVQNIGDVDADETVPVVIESDGERLDTDGVGPLQVDETASGSFDVPVTPTGRYTVSVDPNDEVETIFKFGEEDDWAPRSDEVVVAEPNVYVEDTETERLSKRIVRVNVSLVNSGGVPLRNMKMSVSDGEDFIANTTVGSVGAKSSEEVSVRVDPERLDSPLMDSFVLDPDSEIDDSAFRFREKSTVLLMPDIAVREPVRYWRDDNESDKRVVASALIENRGAATANAEVVLENVETGERVGRKSVTVRPAVDGVPVFKRVGVALDGDVERGDTLRVSASTERHDPDVTDTATVGTVFITDGIPDGLLDKSEPPAKESEGCIDRRNIGRGDEASECPDDRDLSRGGTNREDTREQDRRSRGRGDSVDRDRRRGGRNNEGR